MPNFVLLIGALLVALGTYSYTASVSGSAMTLIPAMVGAVLVILGLLARRESLKKHTMHGSAAIALLGVLGGIGPLAMGGSDRFPPLMIQATVGMMVLCGILLAASVASFRKARREREQA